MIQATNAFKKLQNIADELIDDRVGIIKFLGEFSREAGAPDFYHFYSEACDKTLKTSGFSWQDEWAHKSNFISKYNRKK